MMSRQRFRGTVLPMIFWTAAACAEAGSAEDSARSEPAAADAAAAPSAAEDAASRASGLIAGTPPGGLEDWITDIRSGLAPVPELAARDEAAALNQVLDLYITRQEYIELYYGADRPLYAGADLDAAVEQAEADFHALMQLLQQATPPSREVVAEHTTRIDAALVEVLDRARAAKATMSPHAGGES